LIPYPGGDLLKMGVTTDQQNEFTFLMRVAYPQDPATMSSYYSETPIQAMRVTSAQAESASGFYGKTDMVFPSRTVGQLERAGSALSSDQLKAGLKDLEAAIQKKHGGGGRGSGFEKPHFVSGLDCIEQGTECNGDAYDTLYPISSNIYISQFCSALPVRAIGALVGLGVGLIALGIFLLPSCSRSEKDESASRCHWCWGRFECCKRVGGNKILFYTLATLLLVIPLIIGIIVGFSIYQGYCQSGRAATIDSSPSRDFYVVYGVNHAATNTSIYASITAYRFSTLTGITSQSSEAEYINSPKVYLAADHPAAPYLFAYRFARDCQAAGLSADGFCYNVALGDLPKEENIFFIERAYVSPVTGVGPLFNETLTASLIHFF
jgi:hypothetical protein